MIASDAESYPFPYSVCPHSSKVHTSDLAMIDSNDENLAMIASNGEYWSMIASTYS